MLLYIHSIFQCTTWVNKEKFTHADTLRGSLKSKQNMVGCVRYDIEVKPDYDSKTITEKLRLHLNLLRWK